MIDCLKRVGFAGAVVVAGVGLSAVAQSNAPAAPKGVAGSAVAWRQKEIRFSDKKAVLGLPTTAPGGRTYCSDDGTTFFNLQADSVIASADSPPALYRVSSTGEVVHLQRKTPEAEYNHVSLRDFFVAEHMLVSLLKAERRDDDDPGKIAREVRYFLSLSDHDGDGAELVALDIRFRPLRVGLFGSGDFIMLGWDEANLLPVLALLKEDGSVRRFIDLDDKHTALPYGTSQTMKDAEASAQGKADLKSLERAVFVPYGSEVLLTYPGTARFVRVLSAVGEDRAIPIKLPGGQVLHDLLVTSPRSVMILRTQELEKSSDEVKEPQQRMFEMSAYNGSLLREFVFDAPIGMVTCAANSRLQAVFLDAIPDVVGGNSSGSAISSTDAKHMVVGSALR